MLPVCVSRWRVRVEGPRAPGTATRHVCLRWAVLLQIPAATGLTPEMAPIMPWTATIDGVNLLEVPLQSLRVRNAAQALRHRCV